MTELPKIDPMAALREHFGGSKRNRAGRRALIDGRTQSGGQPVPRPKASEAARKAAKRASKSRRANRA